jgi:hypothetical protein
MVKFDLDHENRVIKAIDALSKQDTTNIKALAQEYSVSYDTLRRRFLGVPPLMNKKATHARLSEAQEHALYRRIRSQVAYGFPMKKKQIVACAEWILQLSSGGKAQTLGGHWFTRWSKRHPEMHEIHTKAMENSRKSACSAIDIVEWFELLKKCKEEFDIQDVDIWNFDETGFQVGNLKGAAVFVPREIKKAFIRDPHNRELVTCVECVSAAGEALPSFIIVKGASLQERWFRDWQDQGHDPNTSWTCTDSGFINEEKAVEWLDHFIENAHISRRHRTIRPHCLLLMDGHTSHIGPEFIDKCYEFGIVPFCLLPHTTHILQPLDVCVFLPYKHWHQVVMERIVREGAFTFGKDDFLRALPEIKKLAFKKSTIRSGFRDTGIVPFNPNHVLETMGQWVYEHKLTAEQEVAQWQEVFTPLDPYQTIIIDGNTLPAKTQRQIDRDLAFNAREIRQRDIRKVMQEKEAVQNASQITIGEVRPVTPPLLLLSEDQLLKYATPIHPYEIELQAAELDTRLQGYFFNGELLSPSTYHLFKYMSKGGVSGLYQYEMATTQLSRTLERNQQRAATGKDRRQVQFIGRITSEQAGEGVERRFQEELLKGQKAHDRAERRQLKEDQGYLNKQWRIQDREAKSIVAKRQDCLNQEVKEGNKRMWEEEKEKQCLENRANRRSQTRQHESRRTRKRFKEG